MQFMLIFTEPLAKHDTYKPGSPQAAENMGAWGAYMGAMAQAGVLDKGDGLLHPETATTVRVRNGKREVQDGPFLEAKEYLGGYCVISVDDLDAAIAWAEKSPAALEGSVEVRPVMPDA